LESDGDTKCSGAAASNCLIMLLHIFLKEGYALCANYAQTKPDILLIYHYRIYGNTGRQQSSRTSFE
jgi:hypothetical protein